MHKTERHGTAGGEHYRSTRLSHRIGEPVRAPSLAKDALSAMLNRHCGGRSVKPSTTLAYPSSLIRHDRTHVMSSRHGATRHEFFTGASLSLAMCIALFPFARSMFSADVIPRQSQAGLVHYLQRKQSLTSSRIAKVLQRVDRKDFLPSQIPAEFIYRDIPLPLGFEETTISAPHMHAACLELLDIDISEHVRILDVGSGSGYLTTALALLAGPRGFVLGIEKHQGLAEQSIKNIRHSHPRLLSGVSPRVKIIAANALSDCLSMYEWFDMIHVGAAASSLPSALVKKLAPGGRMIIPVGPRPELQELLCVDKDTNGELTVTSKMRVRYVPLTNPTEDSSSLVLTNDPSRPRRKKYSIYDFYDGSF